MPRAAALGWYVFIGHSRAFDFYLSLVSLVYMYCVASTMVLRQIKDISKPTLAKVRPCNASLICAGAPSAAKSVQSMRLETPPLPCAQVLGSGCMQPCHQMHDADLLAGLAWHEALSQHRAGYNPSGQHRKEKLLRRFGPGTCADCSNSQAAQWPSAHIMNVPALLSLPAACVSSCRLRKPAYCMPHAGSSGSTLASCQTRPTCVSQRLTSPVQDVTVTVLCHTLPIHVKCSSHAGISCLTYPYCHRT